MKRKVFISYRRDDDAGDAGRLYDRLRERFDVWFDIKSIRLAEDFPTAIGHAVGGCDALVVVIGRQWLPGTGGPPTDDPADFVRIEVSSALDRGIPTFPVLVDGATMPEAATLPPSLAPLAMRHALELSRTRFDYDVGLLMEAIEQVPRRRRVLPRWAKVAIPVAAAATVLAGSALAASVIMSPSTTLAPTTTVATSTTLPPTTTTRLTATTSSSTSTTVLVTVPNVTGFTAANAQAALENLGLRVVQFTVRGSAKAGTVVNTSPLAGTRVARGSTVTVNVSDGRILVP